MSCPSAVHVPALPETPNHLDITRRDGTVLRVFFDAADYPLISQYRWHVKKGRNTFYARAHVRGADGRDTTIRMHQLIVDAPVVDHIDGNGLNNCRSNLRSATRVQNARNQGKHADAKTSNFKGVCFHKHRNKYYSQIQHNGKRLSLGYFTNEVEAAIAYNAAAKKLHGEFARLNDVKAVAA